MALAALRRARLHPSIFDHITKLRRVRPTTRFKADWRDSWQDLRRLEWLRDQVIAHGLASLLAGKDLDLNPTLVMDPPDDYGGPCPATPFVMNQRFLALARWTTNPEAIIRKRYKRLVKRARISGCPLRLDAAHRSTSPVLRTEEENARANRRRISSSGASRRGRWRATSSSRDGGGSRRHTFSARPRAPPSFNFQKSPTSLPRRRRERARMPALDAPPRRAMLAQ